MNLIRIALLGLLLGLFATPGYGQTVKGTVRDTTGQAIPYAAVSLKNKTTGAIVAYMVTDSKGGFALQGTAGLAANSFTVEVRSIGYKPAVKDIISFELPVDFTLTGGANLLQEVVVRTTRPLIRTAGDTLSYRVSEFASPQDRTIAEVLKKLPGIAVAENGAISYNNKQISALYLGGDNLLDDKYNIATNTIPQDAVHEVQVIQNSQPVKMLQNKVSTDDVALNLTFKKDAKMQLVGREAVGAGIPGNYDADLNAMMFKDKYKAINYVQANNTGSDLQRNLVSLNMGESAQRTENNKPGSLLSLGDLINPNMARNRYLFNQAVSVSANNLINIKNGEQLKVNLSYLHDNQHQGFTQKTEIFLPNDTVRYTERQQNKFRPDILQSQFTLNINKEKYFLNNALITNFSRKSNFSFLNVSSASLDQKYKDNTLDFSNEFDVLKLTKSGHSVFEIYSYINHISKPETRTIAPGNNAALLNNGNPYSELVQTSNVPTWFSNNYLAFRIPAGSIVQSYKAGFSVQSQELNSELTLVQLNSTINRADSAVNQLNWVKRRIYAEATYDLNSSKWKVTLALPLGLQQIKYSDDLYATDKSLGGLYFSPQLRAKYQVSAENYFNFSYSYRNNIGDIQSIYPGRILTDYRTLYANTADLAENKAQRAILGFSYRKAITLLFFNINSSFSHIGANTITSSILSNNIQQRISLPFQNSTDTWSLGAYVSKYSFKLGTTLSAGGDWQTSRSSRIQNNILLPYTTLSQHYNAGAETKISSQLTFSYTANLSLTRSQSPAPSPGYAIRQLLQRAGINYTPVTELSFKLSGENYLTKQPQATDLKYSFVDASMKYRFKKIKADLELNANNIFNLKNYNTLNLFANTFTSGSFNLPGRIVVLKVLFNI